MSIKIGHCFIGRNSKPFIIAEMSGNHNQSLDRALSIVDAAAATGADALKIQTYTADTMTLDIRNSTFNIGSDFKQWEGKNLHDLYKEAYTPWEWHKAIFDRCKEKGLIAFSTPFDESAVDFLLELDVPCFKIASFENTHIPLIRKVAATGKPLIISTGMASLTELSECVEAARGSSCKDLILLKCTSSYPATPENTNLNTIPHMQKLFNCEIGLSDHTMGNGAAVAAVALGATVIEKHFTLSRADGGVDSTFSLEPSEMKALVTETTRAWQALGEIKYGATESEEKSKRYRRSIFAKKDIKAGEIFSKDNIAILRPAVGFPPKYIDIVLGKKATIDLPKGTPIDWGVLKE